MIILKYNSHITIRHWQQLLLLILIAPNWAAALVNPWEKVTTPAPEPVRVIGSYSHGCIQGAVSLLPDAADTFELMRPSRGRYFAHPQLRQFILWLADKVQELSYGKLLVGDIGQPRGGPTTTGHASHQIGLDVDFWFWLNSPAVKHPFSARDKERLSAPSMLNSTQTAIDRTRFKDPQVQILELVANYPQVERIFVNPLIKKELCERTNAANWLHKVRPWWGHHYHFHVRFGCPPNQPECESQERTIESAGCDAELDSWLAPPPNL